MTIIDTHAHIYPDAIAQKAVKSIGEFYSMIPMNMDGTVDCLLRHGRAAGISRFLVHSVATTWERVRSINDYLMHTAAQYPEEMIGFGSLHPDYPEIEDELQRLKAAGMRGVKLHPDIQRFLLDSDASLRMFAALADADMPALVHMGDYRYPYSQPERLAKALTQFPRLRVIGAHLGGWSVWSDAWKTLAQYDNLWVDTSSSLYALKPEEAVSVIRHYGRDKVFFGTDYPMWQPEAEVERFLRLPLLDDEKERICHLNFEAFLGE